MEKEGVEKDYHSFLLRLWRVDVGGKHVWRVSLEDPITKKRRGFANLGELLAYLLTKICDE